MAIKVYKLSKVSMKIVFSKLYDSSSISVSRCTWMIWQIPGRYQPGQEAFRFPHHT